MSVNRKGFAMYGIFSKRSNFRPDTSNDAQIAQLLQCEQEEERGGREERRNQMVIDEMMAQDLSASAPHQEFVSKIDFSRSVVDPRLDLADPNPNIWELYREFDKYFFNGILVERGVQLSWAPKMTSCAGVCGWDPRSTFCSIRLSKHLLQLRPRGDLVETLLHEMIHALLFVTREDDNHESHGNEFHRKMYEINKKGKCNITVFHNFHDEVAHFQRHVWRCNGPCKGQHPYFGYVRRAMNRAPGPNDKWWKQHEAKCSGQFIKISEPEKKKLDQRISKTVIPKSKDIRDFLTKSPLSRHTSSQVVQEHNKPSTSQEPRRVLSAINSAALVPFSGCGIKLGGHLEPKNPRVIPGASSSKFSPHGAQSTSGKSKARTSATARKTPVKTTTIIEIIELD